MLSTKSKVKLAKNLRKEFKKFINKDSISPEFISLNTTRKNVSWADHYHEYDEKRPFRSTPYPHPSKKMKISYSTPIALSFESDSEECSKNSLFSCSDISSVTSGKPSKKRKRSKNAAFSNWTVTSSNEIKPDKSNRSCDIRSKLRFIKASSSENLNFENTTHCDVIIANENLSSYELDVNTSEDFNNTSAEQIFSPQISNLNLCEIIEPKTFSHKNISKKSLTNEIKTNNSGGQPEKTKLKKISHTNIPENTTEQSEKIILERKPIIRFSHHVKSFINDPYCVLILRHPTKLYLYGKISLIVLSGAIEILGHILTFDNNKEIDIYSPRGQCYLSLESIENKTSENLKQLLKKYLSERQINKCLYYVQENSCVIAVKNNNNNMTNYLSKHVAHHLYPKTFLCQRKVEEKLKCLLEVKNNSWKVFRKNEQWIPIVQTALSNLNTGSSKTMLCGGKCVGKSVLLRYMINSLLNDVERVVCIDLDPGQSEFTLSGCVSVTVVDEPIFGPNFTHLKTSSKSFFIGDVNVVNCIDRYLSSVKELLNYCDQNINKNIPWVINYMGFSNSPGLDLIVSVIKLVSPDTVVQINSNQKTRNYPSLLTDHFVQNYIYSFPIKIPERKISYKLKVLESVAEEKKEGEFEFEPRHLREMSILSYFSKMFENDKEITAVPPYSVKMSLIKLHDLLCNKENIPAVLNGNLVALCKTEINETIDKDSIFSCLGFGIVRGIDTESGELYLLTPLTEDELENVNTLIRGNINLSPSIYMTENHQGLVPFVLLGVQQGINSIPKRSYISLKSLFKRNN